MNHVRAAPSHPCGAGQGKAVNAMHSCLLVIGLVGVDSIMAAIHGDHGEERDTVST